MWKLFNELVTLGSQENAQMATASKTAVDVLNRWACYLRLEANFELVLSRKGSENTFCRQWLPLFLVWYLSPSMRMKYTGNGLFLLKLLHLSTLLPISCPVLKTQYAVCLGYSILQNLLINCCFPMGLFWWLHRFWQLLHLDYLCSLLDEMYLETYPFALFPGEVWEQIPQIAGSKTNPFPLRWLYIIGDHHLTTYLLLNNWCCDTTKHYTVKHPLRYSGKTAWAAKMSKPKTALFPNRCSRDSYCLFICFWKRNMNAFCACKC